MEFQVFSLAEVLIYLLTWVIGYAYVLRVNAIDWDENSMQHEPGFELEDNTELAPGEPLAAGRAS
jgi:hypothetical protein